VKWKDILLGAFASLAVTVLGGLAVYYMTKEPDYEKSEKLVYSIQQSASFTGGSQDVALAAITVENDGGVAAKHVSLLVMFKTAEIRDLALATNVDNREAARNVTPKSAGLTFDVLVPKESITLNLLLSTPEKPSVSVRSEASLGIEKPFDPKFIARAARINDFIGYVVPLSGLLMLALTALAAVTMRRGAHFESLSSNRNNAGFLLLHHGFVDEAAAILTSALNEGRYDPYTLSNLAVCRALKGEYEPARQLLRAADFRERSGHAKAVIHFNEALVALAEGKKDEAIATLKKAVARSPAQIRRYCQRSVHFDKIRNDPAFYELVKDA
jgi:tetratricopeptide (TPR) repeat protein